MTWWLWGLVANLAIGVVEYVNRTGGYSSFWAALPVTAAPLVLAQIGLFYCWKDAPSMMMGWAVFTLGNVVIRLLSVRFLVGETLSPLVLLGVVLIVLGGRVVSVGTGK